jgi:formylglycine-generating enzyme required for sulfatase activity
MSSPTRRILIGILLGALVFGEQIVAFGDDATKPHIAVVRFSNRTGINSYDAACVAATDTLVLTLTQLGRYRVQSEESAGKGEAEFRAMAVEKQLDFIIFGTMSKSASGGIDCVLSVFDRAKGKTALSQSRKAQGVLDIFDATDDLVVSVLESMTGAHIGFGSVTLKNTGEQGRYSVFVDGARAGDNLESLDKVLTGRRTVTIVQKRMLGDRQIASSMVEVKEGEADEVKFSVPYMMDDEKAKIEGLRAAILASWDYANTAANIDSKTTELLSLFDNMYYCPKLSAEKEKARELVGEWALRENRLAIESSAWEPRMELLDAVAPIYLDAKSYLDPTKIRQVFEENVQLVLTLLEMKAGKALGNGDLDKGLGCFKDALMLSTRYLDGARMTDYAYAITTLKDLQGKNSNGAMSKDDQSLKAVFGDWILAGQRFYGMRDQVEAGTGCILVASDLTRPLSADGDVFSQAPRIVREFTEPRSVNVQPKGLAKPLVLKAAIGERLLFTQDGFESFGKPAIQSADAPVLDAHKILGLPANFVFVPGGIFMMGSPRKEVGRNKNEIQHQVSLSSYTISKFDVTFDEYDEYCTATGVVKPKDMRWGRGSQPVIDVSWFEAVAYCNWRSTREGRMPAYAISGTNVSWDRTANGYRLPTEAEWEYAAKGGQAASSLVVSAVYAGEANLAQVAWYVDNSDGRPHEVGQKRPNSLGLYDMAGNVWQWCWDCYGDYYARSSLIDPSGPASGDYHVDRGGSCNNFADSLRSAGRNYHTPVTRSLDIGFRLAVSQISN